jgi:chaperone BCS1
VDFKHASKWQAEGIFKNFFPTKPKFKKEETAALTDVSPNVTSDSSAASALPSSEKPKCKNPTAPTIPLLEEEELADLAKQFAAQIPEDEMSVRIHSSSILSLFEPESCVSLGFVDVSCRYKLLFVGPVLSVWFRACDMLHTLSLRLACLI